MAATTQQGKYLATTLTGFTAFPAGLVVSSSHAGLGVIVAIAGAALLLVSAFGLYRSKKMEATS